MAYLVRCPGCRWRKRVDECAVECPSCGEIYLVDVRLVPDMNTEPRITVDGDRIMWSMTAYPQITIYRFVDKTGHATLTGAALPG